MTNDLVNRLREDQPVTQDMESTLQCALQDEAADRIDELEAQVAALRATLKVLDDQPDITVAEHVEMCAFLGAHLPQAAAMTKGQADD